MANRIAPSWYAADMVPTRRAYLVYTNLSQGTQGSNKEVMLELFSKNGYTATRTRFGKVGEVASGKAQTAWRDGDEFDAIYKDKTTRTRDRYDEVKLADQSVAPVKVAKSAAHTPVEQFLAHITAESKGMIANVLRADVTVNDFAPEQIQAAISLLKRIAAEVKAYDRNPTTGGERTLIEYSNQYYKTIPHKTGDGPLEIPRNIRSALGAAIHSNERIKLEYDFLDTLQAAVGNKVAYNATTAAGQMAALGIDVALADAATTKRIQEFVTRTQGRHAFRLRPGRVFDICNHAVQKAFDGRRFAKDAPTPLFHGSRNSNWFGLLSKGVLIKPAGIPTTGSMFGHGCYFADLSTKSAQYSRDGRSNPYYLMIADVALGKMKVFEHAQPHLMEAPRGYDSVKGERGSSLMNNEYIIYRTEQHCPRHIVEIEFI